MRNEILALRWDDIDLASGMVTVRHNVEHSKTHGRRRAEAGTGTATASRRRCPRRGRGRPLACAVTIRRLCFPAANRADVTALRSPTSVSNLFGQHAAEAGFPGLTLHDTRAGHGTVLLDNGVAVRIRSPSGSATIRRRCFAITPAARTIGHQRGVHHWRHPGKGFRVIGINLTKTGSYLDTRSISRT
jgi:integrase